MFRDFKPIVVEECTGTTLPHLHEPALEMIRVGWGEVRSLERDARRRWSGSREARCALPPRGLPGLRRVRARGGASRLRPRLARRRPDALAGPLRLHDARARGDRADRGRQRRHEPAHAPPGGDGERARDARRPAPGTRASSGSAAATTRCGRSGSNPVPTAELAETVPRLRAWMAGQRGCRRRASAGRTSSVPIMLCATGPKNLRVAGALADIVMIYVGVHPASVRWAIEHVRAGAEEAGRDPDEVEIAALCAHARLRRPGGGVGAVPLGAGRVREPHRVRAEVEPRARHARGDDASRRSARPTYDYYAGHLDSSAEHTSYLTGELVDDFAIAGPAERCLEKIARAGRARGRRGLRRVPEREVRADGAGRAGDHSARSRQAGA